jgi:NMT1-like family
MTGRVGVKNAAAKLSAVVRKGERKVPGVALAALLITFAAPAEAEHMIRYAHPVWRNGHYVLFHGVWRGGKGSHGHAKASDDDDDDDDSAKSDASSDHEFIVLVDTDDATALRMATELVDTAKGAKLKAHAWAGKTSPGAIARDVAADGGDFVVTAIDVLASDPAGADLRSKAPLVARLANEPITIIAREGVDDIKQLDGRPVSFGETDGVVDASGQALFAKLGVTPKVVHQNVQNAMGALLSGRIDAVVAFGADESKAISDAAKGGKLHAISIPWRDDLAPRYAPARLTDKDLPHLTPSDGGVDTIGVPFGLVAVDAVDGSARATQDAPFVTALFQRYQPLLANGADPKWREVNLAADTDWPRLAPARDWLDKHRSQGDPNLDAFREAARSASGDSGATGPSTADKLYGSLLRSSGPQP